MKPALMAKRKGDWKMHEHGRVMKLSPQAVISRQDENHLTTRTSRNLGSTKKLPNVTSGGV